MCALQRILQPVSLTQTQTVLAWTCMNYWTLPAWCRQRTGRSSLTHRVGNRGYTTQNLGRQDFWWVINSFEISAILENPVLQYSSVLPHFWLYPTWFRSLPTLGHRWLFLPRSRQWAWCFGRMTCQIFLIGTFPIYLFLAVVNKHIDAYWCILMHIDAYWCILMHIDAYWCILMHIDAYWCILMHIDAYWCILMHIVCLCATLVLKRSEQCRMSWCRLEAVWARIGCLVVWLLAKGLHTPSGVSQTWKGEVLKKGCFLFLLSDESDVRNCSMFNRFPYVNSESIPCWYKGPCWNWTLFLRPENCSVSSVTCDRCAGPTR